MSQSAHLVTLYSLVHSVCGGCINYIDLHILTGLAQTGNFSSMTQKEPGKEATLLMFTNHFTALADTNHVYNMLDLQLFVKSTKFPPLRNCVVH